MCLMSARNCATQRAPTVTLPPSAATGSYTGTGSRVAQVALSLHDLPGALGLLAESSKRLLESVVDAATRAQTVDQLIDQLTEALAGLK